MGIRKFNSEGYYDPTPHEALKSIRDYRPLVYVCSPFSGDTQANAEKARRYSRFAVDRGAIPIAPHLLFPQFLSEDTERELAMFMDMVLLTKCEQLWVFGSAVSEGMRREIEKAKKKYMTIRYFTEDLKEGTECR
ncbi:MAG: DUF4406 domain-containing protein [Lachnospiraceae bacterium]|nr:DUF4406 domain-containing protein [Lachnospiraceae bacterium]